MKHYTSAEKQSVIERYGQGEPVLSISSSTGIARSTIYLWLKKELQMNSKGVTLSLSTFRKMEQRVTRAETVNKIIHTIGCSVYDPLSVKLPAIKAFYGIYPVNVLCDAMSVPKGTFYNYLFRGKGNGVWYLERREKLKLIIQEIYDDSRQIYGGKKIWMAMKAQGYHISEKMVRELMNELGIKSAREGSKKLYEKEQDRYRNRVKQQFNTCRPNEIWVSDITTYRLGKTYYHICAIMDLYSRRIVGYKIGERITTQLVKATFRMAYEDRNPTDPLIFHTDRGAVFKGKAFISYLDSLGVKQSFSKAHTPYDNSPMESFFSNLKKEELYRKQYRSEKEFKAGVRSYMDFYNAERIHASNLYKTPEQKELEYASIHVKIKE